MSISVDTIVARAFASRTSACINSRFVGVSASSFAVPRTACPWSFPFRSSGESSSLRVVPKSRLRLVATKAQLSHHPFQWCPPILVTGGEGGTKNHEQRTAPMTNALRALLGRLRTNPPPQPSDFVAKIDSAKNGLAAASRRLGYPRFTHHDFRHFFATTCIEAGVDIPTVSRWLGHKDGGALAMRVYGHLRQEHSLAAIKRVMF